MCSALLKKTTEVSKILPVHISPNQYSESDDGALLIWDGIHILDDSDHISFPMKF